MLTPKEVAKLIDHALLKPDMTRQQVAEGINLAIKYDAKSVCVRSCDVKFAADMLKGTNVECGCVVGFPHGNCTTQAKVAETIQAFKDGVQEVDMVLPIGLLKSGEYDYVENDIAQVTKVCHDNGAIVKVIFENCYLTADEIIKASEISSQVGVDFIKTSTGFGTYGARMEDILLMREHSDKNIKLKASGGIRTLDDVIMFYEAGCERIGASATDKIVEEAILRESEGK